MLKLSSGKSEKDRISFYTSENGATAIRGEDGTIDIKLGKENVDLAKALTVIFVIFGTLSLIKAYIIMPLIKNATIAVGWYFIPTAVYVFLTIVSIIVVRKTGGKELLKNHGAEHMVFTAYKKLKRVPTIEEAKRFSRINKACGVTIYSAFITAQIIGFVVYIKTGFVISELILFMVPLLFQTVFPLNLLGKLAQFFTTTKPEDKNIELAIAAVSALETRQQLKDMVSEIVKNAFKN